MHLISTVGPSVLCGLNAALCCIHFEFELRVCTCANLTETAHNDTLINLFLLTYMYDMNIARQYVSWMPLKFEASPLVPCYAIMLWTTRQNSEQHSYISMILKL